MTNLNAVACPHCDTIFVPRRKNQKFCCGKCRKLAHQVKERKKTPRNSRQCREVYRDNIERLESLISLTEAFYATRPDERLGFIKDLVDKARQGDRILRRLLTNKYFSRATYGERRWLFHRKAYTYPNVARAADNYCKRFWKARVEDVVRDNVPEPETGESRASGTEELTGCRPAPEQNVFRTYKAGRKQGACKDQEEEKANVSREYRRVPLSELKRLLRMIPGYIERLTQYRYEEVA